MGERMPARFCVPSALTEHRCSAHRVPRKTGGGMVAADRETARPDTQGARTERTKRRRRSREGMRRRCIRHAGEAGATPPRLAGTARARAAVNTANAARSAAAERFAHTPKSIAYFEYIEVCCVAMLARTCSGGGNVFPCLRRDGNHAIALTNTIHAGACRSRQMSQAKFGMQYVLDIRLGSRSASSSPEADCSGGTSRPSAVRAGSRPCSQRVNAPLAGTEVHVRLWTPPCAHIGPLGSQQVPVQACSTLCRCYYSHGVRHD